MVVALAFHLFAGQVKDRLIAPARLATKKAMTETVAGEKTDTHPMWPNGHTVEETLSHTSDVNQVRQDKIDQRREVVRGLLSEGLAEMDIADRLGVSLKTIKRDILALNGAVQP